jgi:hypothetical protein
MTIQAVRLIVVQACSRGGWFDDLRPQAALPCLS